MTASRWRSSRRSARPRAPQVGQQQAKLYADCLEAEFGQRPVIFYTNGYEHWIWDDTGGLPAAGGAGLLHPDELELMIQRRRPACRWPARRSTTPSSSGTTSSGRSAVGEAFEREQRQALLVMATGSGKTRTVIALVDLLMRANWVKRVLFLADRIALVNQAVNAFKTHLPGATTVNLVTEKATDGRVYVSTYPTMMGLINESTGGSAGSGRATSTWSSSTRRTARCTRSTGAIFEWFDSLLVGLPRHPKDEIDHNTYGCSTSRTACRPTRTAWTRPSPTGFLVPPRGVGRHQVPPRRASATTS